MKRFCAALGFLTVIPLPFFCRHTKEDLIRSVPFFPLVGLLIGALMAGIAIALDSVFPSFVLSIILVGCLVAIHGGLHLDGLSDTADGFFSPYGRERVLQIMKDSNIGAFGCIAIVGILALKVAALVSLSSEHRIKAILLAPLAGRCVMVLLLGFLPSARPEGLGHLFSRHRSIFGLLWAVFVLLGTAWLTAHIAGLIAGIAAMSVIVAFSFFCKRRIGGITGDTVGAANEIAEAVVLVLLSAQPISGLWI